MTSHRSENVAARRGVTGIETAIILIAFVVVATVFAFTVLSTGVFSAERSKETIYSGLESARSSLEPRGSFVAFRGAHGSTPTNTIYKVSFIVVPSVSGEGVDLTPPYTTDASGTDPDIVSNAEYRTVVSYTDQNQFLPDVPWTVSFIGNSDGDNFLEAGEKAEMTVWLLQRDNAVADINAANAVTSWTADANGAHGILATGGTILTANDIFTLEVKPNVGAVTTLERTVPVRLDPVMDLR